MHEFPNEIVNFLRDLHFPYFTPHSNLSLIIPRRSWMISYQALISLFHLIVPIFWVFPKKLILDRFSFGNWDLQDCKGLRNGYRDLTKSAFQDLACWSIKFPYCASSEVEIVQIQGRMMYPVSNVYDLEGYYIYFQPTIFHLSVCDFHDGWYFSNTKNDRALDNNHELDQQGHT